MAGNLVYGMLQKINSFLGESKSRSYPWLFSLHSLFLSDLLIVYLCWWTQYSISSYVLCPELQIGIHPVSIGHSCMMSYRFLSFIMFTSNLLSPSFCSKYILLPVCTILIHRTTIKPVLKVRKLAAFSLFHFHVVSKSYWSYPPNISYKIPLSVLTVRVFIWALSISCLMYGNSLLTLSLPPCFLLVRPPWLKPEWAF